MSTTRQQVFAAIVETMFAAIRDGRDPWSVAAATFPGVPSGILGEAYGEACAAADEKWWQQVERTIDGEAIRDAIAQVSNTALRTL